jgi:pimeloyl-ACP methyl ester carboxylesterase
MAPVTAELARTAIRIPISGQMALEADIAIPPDAAGVVLFAHGSGSSRHSRRNRSVAAELSSLRIATVLADLLTAEEEDVDLSSGALRFDIPMLTARVVRMIDWAQSYDLIASLPIGLFGASTGAAAALDAAAARPDVVRAVVSRGGRPDLAAHLNVVKAPTLLIVGGDDRDVLALNVAALGRLTCTKKLEIVPRATHLFEEPGALQQVASLAGAWFEEYLPAQKGKRP